MVRRDGHSEVDPWGGEFRLVGKPDSDSTAACLAWEAKAYGLRDRGLLLSGKVIAGWLAFFL
jgi:hypothetical protein